MLKKLNASDRNFFIFSKKSATNLFYIFFKKKIGNMICLKYKLKFFSAIFNNFIGNILPINQQLWIALVIIYFLKFLKLNYKYSDMGIECAHRTNTSLFKNFAHPHSNHKILYINITYTKITCNIILYKLFDLLNLFYLQLLM